MNKTVEILNQMSFQGVVMIKKNNKVICQLNKGERNRSELLSNLMDTKFGIASGTKFFTALGIMRLIDDGHLSLDSKLFDVIEKPFDAYADTVTIENLLRHRSGLPDYYDEDYITDFDNFKVEVPWHELKKPSDYMKIMPHRAMKYPVDTTLHYNNSGYVFLAMVIEKITGDYHGYLHEMFSKLQLKNTGFFYLDQLPFNTANGYIEWENGYKTNIYTLPIIGGGDGGLFTNAEDMLQVWEAFLNGDIVSKDLVEKALTPIDSNPYGFGLWLTEYDGTLQPSISGMDAGVSFVSVYRRDLDLNYVILSNNDSDAFKLAQIIKENAEAI
ncbi:MAG: serine hydrolase [Clostridia bacterium]|nr:serine hydrolase [Clostridia bacterium]